MSQQVSLFEYGEVALAAAGGSGQQAHRRGQRCDGRTLIIRYEPTHLVQLELLGVTGLPPGAISIAALGASSLNADDLSFNEGCAIIARNV